jgi:hypothetical protein
MIDTSSSCEWIRFDSLAHAVVRKPINNIIAK